MSDRSHSRDWTALLPAESARWVKQGIIDDSQRQAVLSLSPEPGAGARDRTVLIFTILGSLLVGIGVILFFAANWPSIPAAVKVGVILAAVLGAYGAGFYLQYGRSDYPRLGHALIFLGSLLYGAAIFLLAQIFHLNAHYPQGFLFWSAGLLPLILVTRSKPVLYLSLITLVIWTFNEQAAYGSYNFLFPVLLLGALLPLTRLLRAALGEAGALVALFLWFFTALMNHDRMGDTTAGLMLAARVALLYGGVLMTVGFARLGHLRAYLATGAVIALAGAYAMTFRLTGLQPDIAHRSLFAGPPLLTATASLLLLAAAGTGWFCFRRQPGNRLLLLPVLLMPVIAALGAGLLAHVPLMVVSNLLLFAGTVGLLALGIQLRSELLVNLGLAIFLIHVLTRYFDLFFSAMNRSGFFILGGILLLVGGWFLERNRRRWTRDWGGDGDAN